MFYLFAYGDSAVAEPYTISIPPTAHTECDFDVIYASKYAPHTLLDIPGHSCDAESRSKMISDSLLPPKHCAQAYSTIARYFAALQSLSDGWYDGAGNAPDAAALDTIKYWMLEAYPPQIPVPAIVPTPEGNVLFEWDTPGDPSVDIRLSDLHAVFHAFRPGETDLEHEFDLRTDEDRTRFLAFLCEAVGGAGQ